MMIRGIADRLLAAPIVYNSYQWLVGAPRCHARFMAEMVRPRLGERVLDVGCGIGASLRFLSDGISYVGIDISPAYIRMAQARHNGRGTFVCADAACFDPRHLDPFDRAFSFGVLHHLSDGMAARAIDLVCRVLRPGGAFITIDPCYVPGQSAIAKFLIDNDRGEHVRDQAGFERLFSGIGTVRSKIFHDLLRIPYTQIVMHVTFE